MCGGERSSDLSGLPGQEDGLVKQDFNLFVRQAIWCDAGGSSCHLRSSVLDLEQRFPTYESGPEGTFND